MNHSTTHLFWSYHSESDKILLFQGEDVYTQKRCTECVCRNGEIRCETVICDQELGCSGPDYLCGAGNEDWFVVLIFGHHLDL